MEERSFVTEMITCLRKSADEIEKNWELFKKGEINKEQFEEDYHHVLHDWLLDDNIESEIYYPNNGCKYCETNPTVEYFKQMNI